MSAGINPMDPRQAQLADLLRLFDAQALGTPQTFSGTSGTIVEPPPPPPQSLFRPNGATGPGGQAVAPPQVPPPVEPAPEVPAPQATAPDATPMVPPMPPGPPPGPPPPPPPPPMPETTGSVPGPMPQPMPPQMPPQGPQGPGGGLGGLGAILAGLSKPQAYNTLLGIGTGLMSTRGFGPGFAAGIGNASQFNKQQAITDLANAELEMKRAKIAREDAGENATARYLMSKGLDPAAAMSAVSNPAVLSSVLQQLNKDPSRVQIGGQIYELKPGERPNAGNLLGPAEAERALTEVGIGGGLKSKAYVSPDGKTVLVGQPYSDRAPTESEYDKEAGAIRARKEAVEAAGKNPNDPQEAAFIASGRYPKEDQQKATAVDKKMIGEAEDQALQLDNTISTLKTARDLNRKTYEGKLAGARGQVGDQFPDWLVPDAFAEPGKAAATREFGQIMSMEAIKSMSDTLKGATTDREMGRFMEILGDPTTSFDLRERTIDRMLSLAQRQQELAKARAEDVRGGAYFQQGYQPGRGRPSQTVPQAARSPQQPTQAEVVKITTPAERDLLPSGTWYEAPDGTRRMKP